jgi:hypothetical protein
MPQNIGHCSLNYLLVNTVLSYKRVLVKLLTS